MLNASCAFVWKQGTPKSCVLSSFPPLEFGVIDRLTPFFSLRAYPRPAQACPMWAWVFLVLAAADDANDASCHLELRREVTWNLRLRIHDAGNT